MTKFLPRETVRLVGLVLAIALGNGFQASLDAATPNPRPQTRIHSHNDYEHTRPLLEALDEGICSVEADIHLFDNELRVAHDRSKALPGRTLQALYLDPLRERIRRNGGTVHPGHPNIQLLIDIKASGNASWACLRGILDGYKDILTRFDAQGIHTNAVTVVLSGDRPDRPAFAAEPVRYAGLDGLPKDLGADPCPPAGLVPLISASWSSVFKWRGTPPMPPDELATLRQLVKDAHAQGRAIRFWGAPDRPDFWKLLFDEKIDWINTDRIHELPAFLNNLPATAH